MEKRTMIEGVPSLTVRWIELVDYTRDGYEMKGAN